jgi:hypothetical protein
MNRLNCELDRLGRSISDTYEYKTVKRLPLSLYGIITSGFYGNIYAGSANKYGPRKINYLLPDKLKKNMLHSPDKHFIIKLMHDSKYNRRDINRLRKVQPILRAGICPHFPIMYGYFRIENVTFRGIHANGVTELQNISKKVRSGPAVGYFMENLGHMTMENYVFWKPETNELKQIMFQCYIGIYALVKYARMNHGDFHFKNVMVLKLKRPRVYTYIIDGVKYTVEAKQYMPIIIDINGNFTGQKISQMKDILKLSKQIKKFLPEMWSSMKISLDNTTLKTFFENNFSEYKSKHNASAQISNDLKYQAKNRYIFF